jgi:hypothetical protein
MPIHEAAMTSRERMLAALQRQPVDYVPCSPFFNPLTEVQRRGRKWRFPWGGDSGRERLEYCVTELGLDMVVNCGVGGYDPHPDVSSRVWREGDRLYKAYATPAGELRSCVKYDHRWPHGEDIPFYTDFNPSHGIEFWIESEEDLECFSHILRPLERRLALERSRANYEAARALADRWQLATICHIGMGLTGALQLFGPANLCMLTVDNPGLVHRYLDVEHEVNLRNIEVAMDLGVDIVRRNGFYETCDWYSPAMLEEFLFAKLQTEVDLVHQAGKVAGYTVHTGVMPMLDYLRRLRFDCLLHVEIAFHDMDMAKLRHSQDGTKSFWTGPSSTYHLYQEDPEPTRQAVRDCFEILGPDGLILTPCPSGLFSNLWENILAMLDEWRRLR